MTSGTADDERRAKLRAVLNRARVNRGIRLQSGEPCAAATLEPEPETGLLPTPSATPTSSSSSSFDGFAINECKPDANEHAIWIKSEAPRANTSNSSSSGRYAKERAPVTQPANVTMNTNDSQRMTQPASPMAMIKTERPVDSPAGAPPALLPAALSKSSSGGLQQNEPSKTDLLTPSALAEKPQKELQSDMQTSSSIPPTPSSALLVVACPRSPAEAQPNAKPMSSSLPSTPKQSSADTIRDKDHLKEENSTTEQNGHGRSIELTVLAKQNSHERKPQAPAALAVDTNVAESEPQEDLRALITRRLPPRSGKSVTPTGHRSSFSSPAPVKARSPLDAQPPPSLDDYEDGELHSDYLHTLNMLIPESSSSCIIGHGGADIRAINAQTDCTLSIRDPKSSPFPDDRVLRIYGKAKGICLAQRLVIDRIRSDRARRKDPNYLVMTPDQSVMHVPEESVTSAMELAAMTQLESEELDEPMDAEAYEPPSDGQPVKWLVQTDQIGRIMGSGGLILRGIARDTRTQIHIKSIQEMPPGSTERLVTISGPPHGIEAARQSIVAKAGGRPETPSSNGKLGQYFAIPYASAGFLIGVHGIRMREIAERTGARLQIPQQQDLPLGSLTRVLHVQGSGTQIKHALRIVSARLREFWTSEDAAKAHTQEISIRVLLPIHICSTLLDQRGKLIKEISEKAGAFARFLPENCDNMRICMFTGEMAKVFRAQRLVLQVVAGDEIAMKRLAGVLTKVNGNGPRSRKRTRGAVEEDDEDDDDDEVVNTRSMGRSGGRGSGRGSTRGRQSTRGRGISRVSAPPSSRRGPRLSSSISSGGRIVRQHEVVQTTRHRQPDNSFKRHKRC